MEKFPKVDKGFSRLSNSDRLRNITSKLLAGAFLTAGFVISADASSDAKVIPTWTPSIVSSPGNAIILAPIPRAGQASETLLPFHQSHQSHYSHQSHQSHQSHYSSR